MFGNLSIRSRVLALLAVPVAAAVLLGLAGATAAWADRAMAASLQAPDPASSAACSWPSPRPRRRPARSGSSSPPPPAGARAPAAPAVARDPGADARPRLRLTAVAVVARHQLNGVRAAAGSRLEEIDRAFGAPVVRAVRRMELALLDPAAGRAGVGDLDLWWSGLTARAAGLRRLERAVAGELAWATTTRLARREAGLRGRLVLLAVTVLASLAAVLLLWRGPLGRATAGQDRSMVPGWPGGPRRWRHASLTCSASWSPTTRTGTAARACSGSTTWPTGCAVRPRP